MALGGRLGAAGGFGVRSANVSRTSVRRASSAARGVPIQLYQNVWRKSNILYVTYIVAGCVALEILYGGITNGIWDLSAYGFVVPVVDLPKRARFAFASASDGFALMAALYDAIASFICPRRS